MRLHTFWRSKPQVKRELQSQIYFKAGNNQTGNDHFDLNWNAFFALFIFKTKNVKLLPEMSYLVFLTRYSMFNIFFFFLLLTSTFLLNAQEVAEDFTYPDFNGKAVSLSDFKGKVVYIEVWASWCKFCRKELPHAKRLERLFKKDNIVFLNISIEQNVDNWKDFIDKKKISGVHLITKQIFESEIVKQYGIKGIPHFILIDKNGNIVSKNASRPSSLTIVDEITKLLEE